MLYHPERMLNVHPKLQACAAYVAAHVPFDVGIPVDGGLRTQAQQDAAAAAGNSNAATLDATPHGCGCALDIVPYGYGFDAGAPALYGFSWTHDDWNSAVADAVEAFGMTSGRNFVLPSGGGDPTHAELPNWVAVRDSWRATVGMDPSTGGIAMWALGALLVLSLGGFFATYFS